MTKKEQDVIINEAVKRVMQTREEIYQERDVIWVKVLQKYVNQNVAIDFYHKEIAHDYVDAKDIRIMELEKELKDLKNGNTKKEDK